MGGIDYFAIRIRKFPQMFRGDVDLLTNGITGRVVPNTGTVVARLDVVRLLPEVVGNGTTGSAGLLIHLFS